MSVRMGLRYENRMSKLFAGVWIMVIHEIWGAPYDEPPAMTSVITEPWSS